MQSGKKEILQFLLVLAEQNAICTTRAHASHHRLKMVVSFESTQSLLYLLEQRAHVHLLFSSFPGLAALLRSDGFFSGAVCFVRRTLAKGVFHGSLVDSKGAKVCKSCRSRQELSNEYLVFTCKIRLR